MPPELTMVLHNWARESQLHEVIGALRRQSLPTQIIVWNNNPEIRFRDDRADWVIDSDRNAHGRLLVALWQAAGTTYVGRMDDDLTFTDDDVLADALEVLRQSRAPTQIVGAYGVRIYADSDYSGGQHIAIPKGHGQQDDQGQPLPDPRNQPVDVIKGRIMLLRSGVLHTLSSGVRHVHTDLYVSTALAGQHRRHHLCAGCFWDGSRPAGQQNRLRDFPEDDLGYCRQDGHEQLRNEICDLWLSQCLPSKKVRPKPDFEPPPDDLEPS